MNDLELAGICGAHFEDQVTPKRCGGMHGVQVESAGVFAKKIETAVKYRKDPNFLVIARSDAVEVTGVDDAIRRMNLAAAAGADMGFLFSAKGVCDNVTSRNKNVVTQKWVATFASFGVASPDARRKKSTITGN